MSQPNPTPPAEVDVAEVASYATLREANHARQIEWDKGNKISLSYRGNEMAGECGEACNVIKKLERERLGIRGSRATVDELASELADVIICADLIAMMEGIDLDAAVAAKFNATSEKVGLRTRYVPALLRAASERDAAVREVERLREAAKLDYAAYVKAYYEHKAAGNDAARVRCGARILTLERIFPEFENGVVDREILSIDVPAQNAALIQRLTSSPIIEGLTPTMRDMQACVTVGDTYDMMKARIKATLTARPTP